MNRYEASKRYGARTSSDGVARSRGARRLAGIGVVGLAAMLGGCQSLSSPSPVAPEGSGALPAACQWPAGGGDRLERLRITREALEARGYAILDTDATLGVVSAERRTRQPGLGAVDSPFGRTGFWGGFGFGGRHGYGVGLSRGFGYGYDTDPVQVERLSVATPEATTYVGRDSVVVDRNGYLIDARRYNREGLCDELRQEIESRLADRQSGVGAAMMPSAAGEATP